LSILRSILRMIIVIGVGLPVFRSFRQRRRSQKHSGQNPQQCSRFLFSVYSSHPSLASSHFKLRGAELVQPPRGSRGPP
jgi:hypothetical protein